MKIKYILVNRQTGFHRVTTVRSTQRLQRLLTEDGRAAKTTNSKEKHRWKNFGRKGMGLCAQNAYTKKKQRREEVLIPHFLLKECSS
jgi:hypothetical protein